MQCVTLRFLVALDSGTTAEAASSVAEDTSDEVRHDTRILVWQNYRITSDLCDFVVGFDGGLKEIDVEEQIPMNTQLLLLRTNDQLNDRGCETSEWTVHDIQIFVIERSSVINEL